MDLVHTYYVPGTVALPSLSSNLPKKLTKTIATSTAAAAGSYGARDWVCEASVSWALSSMPSTLAREGDRTSWQCYQQL